MKRFWEANPGDDPTIPIGYSAEPPTGPARSTVHHTDQIETRNQPVISEMRDLSKPLMRLESDHNERLERLEAVVSPMEQRSVQRQRDDLEERFRRLVVDKLPNPVTVEPSRRRSYYQPGIEQRVLTRITATQALPVHVHDQVLMHMVENSALLAAGATLIVTEDGDQLQVPASTVFGTGALVGEGTTAGSDPTLTVRALNAWKYMAFVQVTRELALDSQSDILGFLAAQAGQALALAFGPHLATGTGTGQPQGIVTGATVGVTGPTGTSTSLGAQGTAGQGTDLLWSLVASVADPYTLSPSCGFLMSNAGALAKIHQLKDSTGQPVIPTQTPKQLLGYPCHVDPFVASMAPSAKSIVFGDVSRYYIRMVGGVDFQRSDHYAFNTDQVSLRATVRLDGILADQAAVKLFVNSAT